MHRDQRDRKYQLVFDYLFDIDKPVDTVQRVFATVAQQFVAGVDHQPEFQVQREFQRLQTTLALKVETGLQPTCNRWHIELVACEFEFDVDATLLPGIAVLATSREELGLPGEVRLEVPPLPAADSASPAVRRRVSAEKSSRLPRPAVSTPLYGEAGVGT